MAPLVHGLSNPKLARFLSVCHQSASSVCLASVLLSYLRVEPQRALRRVQQRRVGVEIHTTIGGCGRGAGGGGGHCGKRQGGASLRMPSRPIDARRFCEPCDHVKRRASPHSSAASRFLATIQRGARTTSTVQTSALARSLCCRPVGFADAARIADSSGSGSGCFVATSTNRGGWRGEGDKQGQRTVTTASQGGASRSCTGREETREASGQLR